MMASYRYRRTAIRPDGTRHIESVDMSSEELINRTGRDSELHFLRLLCQWNAVSLRGQVGSLICIYIPEVTSG